MSDYQVGKDIGNIMARLESIEKKLGGGCGCGSNTEHGASFSLGTAQVVTDAPDGELQKDTSLEALLNGCGGSSNGHIRTTRTPPEAGYPSNVDYCQMCCIGNGDNGWYYAYKYVNNQKIYAARGGLSVTISCGGSNYILGC